MAWGGWVRGVFLSVSYDFGRNWHNNCSRTCPLFFVGCILTIWYMFWYINFIKDAFLQKTCIIQGCINSKTCRRLDLLKKATNPLLFHWINPKVQGWGDYTLDPMGSPWKTQFLLAKGSKALHKWFILKKLWEVNYGELVFVTDSRWCIVEASSRLERIFVSIAL